MATPGLSCSENSTSSPGEIPTLVQKILLVHAPIGDHGFGLQGGKLNFAALFCCFYKGTPFSKQT